MDLGNEKLTKILWKLGKITLVYHQLMAFWMDKMIIQQVDVGYSTLSTLCSDEPTLCLDVSTKTSAVQDDFAICASGCLLLTWTFGLRSWTEIKENNEGEQIVYYIVPHQNMKSKSESC